MTRHPILIKSSTNAVDTPLQGQRLVNVSNVFIKSCTIPNTVYTIRQGVNDSIRIGTGVWQDAVLTPGMYSISTLLTELKSVLDGTSIGTFTCLYDDSTFRISITCTNSFSIDSISSLSAPVIGLDRDEVSVTTYLCGSAVNLVSTERLYVRSRSLSQLLQPSMRYVNGSWQSTDCILSVPVDSEPGDILVYTPESDNASYTHVDSGILSRIDAEIVDDAGIQVDLHGVPWTLELVIYAD